MPALDLNPFNTAVRPSRNRVRAVLAVIVLPAIVRQIANAQPSRQLLQLNDFFCSTTGAPQRGQSPNALSPPAGSPSRGSDRVSPRDDRSRVLRERRGFFCRRASESPFDPAFSAESDRRLFLLVCAAGWEVPGIGISVI